VWRQPAPKIGHSRQTPVTKGTRPRVLRHQVRETLAPFDQHHRIAFEDFFQTQRGDLHRRVQAVQANVIHPEIAVLAWAVLGGSVGLPPNTYAFMLPATSRNPAILFKFLAKDSGMIL